MTPAQVFSSELIDILRTSNTFGLKSNKKNTLRGTPCDFIKMGSLPSAFTEEYSEFVSGQICNKTTLRPFIFKIKSLYFFSQLIAYEL